MAKPAALAQGHLEGQRVVVRDVAQANRLHNKAAAGTPQTGNTLALSRIEAAYCVAMGWLRVDGPDGPGAPLGFADLVAPPPGRGHRPEVDYFVYRDLRERGFVVRHQESGRSRFEVLPRGASQGAAAFTVAAWADTEAVAGADLIEGATATSVAAVVDGDGAVTHYAMQETAPVGQVVPVPVPRSHGIVLADRVLLTDAAAQAACHAQHIGNAHPNGTFLSLLEADALVAEGALGVETAAFERATAASAGHAIILPAYRALRARGVVAKSGFRFGTHLRGYSGAPDDEHAPWLLHCTDLKSDLGWSTLSRGVRLAHGVRKEFLVAVAGKADVRFVRLTWFRP